MSFPDVDQLLLDMVAKNATDLYLCAGTNPKFSIDGDFVDAASATLTPEATEVYARKILGPRMLEEFSREREINLSYALGMQGRFRVNVYTQRGTVGLVIRQIRVDTPTLKGLNLPERLGELISAHNGLILVTGAAGSGKSTTFAAMINYRNERCGGHIITIEDPIEFLHQHKKSIISQREVGEDTVGFEIALKNTLRQAPQVIYIGEIRDAQTMEFALHASETGHLVLGTLHSTNANQTIERILNFFPHEHHKQVLFQLSLNIRAILSQRLVPCAQGGRIPALEILIRTPYIANLISKGEIGELKEAMHAAEQDGLQTFDQDLYRLWKEKKVTGEDALGNADSPNNLKLRMQGMGS